MKKKRNAQNQFELMSDSSLIESLLSNWGVLNKAVTKLTRRQVAVLLVAELAGKQREPIIRRLHQRFGIVRSKEEWENINKLLKSGAADQAEVIEKLRAYNLEELKNLVT